MAVQSQRRASSRSALRSGRDQRLRPPSALYTPQLRCRSVGFPRSTSTSRGMWPSNAPPAGAGSSASQFSGFAKRLTGVPLSGPLPGTGQRSTLRSFARRTSPELAHLPGPAIHKRVVHRGGPGRACRVGPSTDCGSNRVHDGGRDRKGPRSREFHFLLTMAVGHPQSFSTTWVSSAACHVRRS